MTRKVTLLALLLIALLLATPWLVGQQLRRQLSQTLQQLPGSDSVALEIVAQRAGWLFSDIDIELRGAALQSSGEAALRLTMQLSHGPLVWHLADSPFAVAAIDVGPARSADTTDTELRYSAAALLQLRRGAELHFSGIAGFAAHGADHMLQWRLHWPLSAQRDGWQAILNSIAGSISVDLDTAALLTSEFEPLARQYQQQRWLRFNQGRALSHITLHDGWLDINGEIVPAGNVLPLTQQ